jgi:outer membrane protein W
MDKKVLSGLFLAGSLVASASAVAGNASNFEGFSVSVGAGYQALGGKLDQNENYTEQYGSYGSYSSAGGGTSGGGTSSSSNGGASSYSSSTLANKNFDIKSGFVGKVEANYNYAINDSFLIGVAASYSSGNAKANSTASVSDTAYENTSVKLSNDFALAVRPSWALSSDFMIYASLAYHNTDLKAASSLILPSYAGIDTAQSSVSDSKRINGVGFGVGFVYNIDKNWFIKQDIERVYYESTTLNAADSDTWTNTYGSQTQNNSWSYGSSTKIEPTTTSGVLSIGYRF